MSEHKKTTNAVDILHRRYVGDDPERKAALEAARVHAEVARTICELRMEAGLSQKELADLIDTTQSAISRLEDEEYEGHSLGMLNRVARALSQKLTVVMTAKEPGVGPVRYAFQLFLQNLRRAHGLSIDKLAEKTEVDREELVSAERVPGYRPAPRTLHRLSEFYNVPHEKLAALAGVYRDIPKDVVDNAMRYAAQSESFNELTKEEREAVDRFVQALRSGK